MLKKRCLTSFVLSICFFTVSGFASETVLLYFYGENPQVPTAPYTKSLIAQTQPFLEELVQQGHPIRGVDAYQNVDFALQWEIKELPTFIMLVNGQAVDRINGIDEPAKMKPRLMQMLGVTQNTAPPSMSPNPLPQLPVSAVPMANSSIQQVNATMPQVVLPQNQPVTMQQSPGLPPSQYDNSFLKATVRLRVNGSKSHDWGTGTIIDASNGQATILTCGHIFRDSQGKGLIEVDFFNENTVKKLHGQLIQYDDHFDIAFVSVTPHFPVTTIPLAPQDYVLHERDAVLSAGCDGGAQPTLKQHQVLSLNKIFSQTTPAFYYVHVDNPPVGGRSGGGLFSKEGYLVGVCNAADSQDGFFVPLAAIRHEMSKKPQLAALDQYPAMTPIYAEPAPKTAGSMPAYSSTDVPQPLQNHNTGTLSLEEQATLEQIQRYQQDGAEIICIIRSNRDQSSDVIRLQSASPQFINALREQTSSSPTTTSTVIAPSTLRNDNSRFPTAFPVTH